MRKKLHLYYYLFIFPFVLIDHYLYICGRVGGGYDFTCCMMCTHMLISWLTLHLPTPPTDEYKHKWKLEKKIKK